MRTVSFLVLAAVVAGATATAPAQRPKLLEIVAIDVEGGQAVLFVSPTGESLLMDAGNPGARDAERIAAAAHAAGVGRIDYLVIAHFHGDHFGGVPELAARVPIGTFVDYGSTLETSERALAGARALFGETTDQGGPGWNASDEFIANLEEQHTTAHAVEIAAREDGSFVVTNQRTGYRKEYAPRP